MYLFMENSIYGQVPDWLKFNNPLFLALKLAVFYIVHNTIIHFFAFLNRHQFYTSIQKTLINVTYVLKQ